MALRNALKAATVEEVNPKQENPGQECNEEKVVNEEDAVLQRAAQTAMLEEVCLVLRQLLGRARPRPVLLRWAGSPVLLL